MAATLPMVSLAMDGGGWLLKASPRDSLTKSLHILLHPHPICHPYVDGCHHGFGGTRFRSSISFVGVFVDRDHHVHDGHRFARGAYASLRGAAALAVPVAATAWLKIPPRCLVVFHRYPSARPGTRSTDAGAGGRGAHLALATASERCSAVTLSACWCHPRSTNGHQHWRSA